MRKVTALLLVYAVWTGAMEFRISPETGRQYVRCQYMLETRTIWLAFAGVQCPPSVDVENY
jgi:hypothetical protein